MKKKFKVIKLVIKIGKNKIMCYAIILIIESLIKIIFFQKEKKIINLKKDLIIDN